MCFSYSVHQSKNALPFDPNNLQIPIPGFFFSGFDHPNLPICTSNERWELAEWGLIPSWAQSTEQQRELQNVTLNARSETASEKPAFINAWNKRPCIVLASGFFEWQHHGKMRIPHYIQHKTEPYLWFAGLYEDVKIESHWTRTYTILTCEANGIMSEIHNAKNRMPLILNNSEIQTWLHGSIQDRKQLCMPQPCNFLKAHHVNPLLNKNSINRNAPWAVESYQKPQTELPF